MKLAMGCDPAAYRFYKKLLERMKEEGYDIVDTGCESENEADGGKYAEIAEIVSNKVVSKECDYGILTKNEILNSTTTFGGGIYSRTVKVYSFI